jgi:hypothetical protein
VYECMEGVDGGSEVIHWQQAATADNQVE